jgi:hypothetical protein
MDIEALEYAENGFKSPKSFEQGAPNSLGVCDWRVSVIAKYVYKRGR